MTPDWKLHVLARNLIYWSEHPRQVNDQLEHYRPLYPEWLPQGRIYSEVSEIDSDCVRFVTVILMARLEGMNLWRFNVGVVAHLLQLLLPEEQQRLFQILKDWYVD